MRGEKEWGHLPTAAACTGLGYSTSQGSLQNKLVSIDKPEPGETHTWNQGKQEEQWQWIITSALLWRGLAGKDAEHTHSTPNSLKMQQDGNQACAQQDVSDSCHQAEGTNFVFFCHSDSGYSYKGNLHIAHLSRTEAGALSSLSSPCHWHTRNHGRKPACSIWEPCIHLSPLELSITFLPTGLDSPEGGVSTSFCLWRSIDYPLETRTSTETGQDQFCHKV